MKDGVPIIERWTGSIKSSGVDINYRRCRRQFPIARAIEVRYSERVQDFARGTSFPYRTTIIPSSLRPYPLISPSAWFETRKTAYILISISSCVTCFQWICHQQNIGKNLSFLSIYMYTKITGLIKNIKKILRKCLSHHHISLHHFVDLSRFTIMHR